MASWEKGFAVHGTLLKRVLKACTFFPSLLLLLNVCLLHLREWYGQGATGGSSGLVCIFLFRGFYCHGEAMVTPFKE